MYPGNCECCAGSNSEVVENYFVSKLKHKRTLIAIQVNIYNIYLYNLGVINIHQDSVCF